MYVFDLITIAQTFINSAFFVRERMLLCADKVLFVLPMCEELQPRRVNSCAAILKAFESLE